MQAPRRLLAALPLAAAVAAAATFGTTDRARAAEAAALYVSGFQIGKGNRALLRLTNVAAQAGDFYDVRVNIFETTAGRQINSRTENLYSLFKDDTLELDIGAIVVAHQGSLGEAGNTRFKGPVQVVISGSDGAFHPFGPETIHAAPVQTEGQATFSAHLAWIER